MWFLFRLEAVVDFETRCDRQGVHIIYKRPETGATVLDLYPKRCRILTYFTAYVAPTALSNTPQLCQLVRFCIRRRTPCLCFIFVFL